MKFDGTGMVVLTQGDGTHSIAYTRTDPVALAKALTKIAKDVPAFQFKSGVVEGRVISISEIKQLAVEDKWLASIEASVQAKVERV